MPAALDPILSLDQMDAGYGAVRVLFGMNLRVGSGEVVALVGRNGAGKTTTLRAILGLADVSSGRVMFGGADLAGESTDERARRGIGYVPQDRRIFSGLSVRENLEVGRRQGKGECPWPAETVLEMFPSLRDLWQADGGELSGGEQQMLAIARALMGNPQLLLLDEPSEGLAPLVVRELMQHMRHLKRNGVSILMSEQNMRFTRLVSDRLYVLESGQVRLEGPGDDPRILLAASQYLTI
ncbi:MAG TPA: ABC transporter ATP-binding protein [Candidatus Baltobacteraceae bacterium]|nr:ABC transporter ATP-binding protein [Candidatus Baltobacteraceae bacterium]